jgi:hypothetical protein
MIKISEPPSFQRQACRHLSLHDDTEQWHGFAIMNAIIDPDTRVSVFGGAPSTEISRSRTIRGRRRNLASR